MDWQYCINLTEDPFLEALGILLNYLGKIEWRQLMIQYKADHYLLQRLYRSTQIILISDSAKQELFYSICLAFMPVCTTIQKNAITRSEKGSFHGIEPPSARNGKP